MFCFVLLCRGFSKRENVADISSVESQPVCAFVTCFVLLYLVTYFCIVSAGRKDVYRNKMCSSCICMCESVFYCYRSTSHTFFNFNYYYYNLFLISCFAVMVKVSSAFLFSYHSSAKWTSTTKNQVNNTYCLFVTCN